MERDSGKRLASLAVDGGLSNSDLTMQFQADVSGIPVDRPAMRETTALGAAIAAGLATGVWGQLADLRDVNRSGHRIFTPCADRAPIGRMVRKWEQAVAMSRGWVRSEEELAQEEEAATAAAQGQAGEAGAAGATKAEVVHVEAASEAA